MKTATMGKVFSSIPALLKFVVTTKGAISFTVILVVLSLWNGVIDSVQEKSFEPLLRDVGGELINHDNELYVESQKVIENAQTVPEKNFFGKVWFILTNGFQLFKNIFYTYTFFKIFYFLGKVITNNESAIASNVFIAILFLAGLQVGAILLNIQYVNAEEKAILENAPNYPFRGAFKFFEAIPYIMNPSAQLLDVQEDTPIVENNNSNSQNNLTNFIDLTGGASA